MAGPIGSGHIDIRANLAPFLADINGIVKRLDNEIIKLNIKPIIDDAGLNDINAQVNKVLGRNKPTIPLDTSGAGKSLRKVKEEADAATKATDGLVRSAIKLRDPLQKALAKGGQLATAFQRLGASGIPLGTTLSRLAGIAVAGQEVAGVLGEAGLKFPRLIAGFNALAGVGTAALAAIAAAAVVVVGGLVAAFKIIQASVPVALQSTAAYFQVAAAIKATGGAAGFTVPQLKAFNEELENTTGTSSTTLAELESILLTFDNVRGEKLTDAIRIANDFMVRFGTSSKEAGRAIGLALQDPARGLENLGEQGIRFTEAEKEVIQNLVLAGNVVEAQEKIFERLEVAVGGAGEAFLKSPKGGIAAFMNSMRDVGDAIGQAALPAIGAVVKGGQEFFDMLVLAAGGSENLRDGIMVILEPLTGLAASALLAGRGLGVVVGSAIRAYKALAPLIRALRLVAGPMYFLAGIAGKVAGEKTKLALAAFDAGNAMRVEQNDARRLAQGLVEVGKAQQEAKEAAIDYERAQLSNIKADYEKAKAARELTEAQRIYQGTIEGFPETSEEARKAQEEFNEAQVKAEQATVNLAQAELAHEKATLDRIEAQKTYNNTVLGFASDSKEAIEAIDDLEDATRALERAQLDLLEAQNKLKESALELGLQQKLAGFITKAYGVNSFAAQKANIEVEKTTLGLRDAQLDVRDSQNEVGDAQRELTEQQRVTNGVLHGYALESKEAKKALLELREAELQEISTGLAIRSAFLANEAAAHELKTETRELRGVLEGFPASSKEAIEALDKLKTAEFNATSTTIDYKDAVLELAKARERSNKADQKALELHQAHNRAREQDNNGVSFFEALRDEPRGSRPPGHHMGGTIRKGQYGIVGEYGPELAFAGTDTQIIPIKKASAKTSVINITERPAVLAIDGRVVMRALLPHMQALIRENN